MYAKEQVYLCPEARSEEVICSKWISGEKHPAAGRRYFWSLPDVYTDKHPVIAVIVPMYNEEAEALHRTLQGLALMQMELYVRYHVHENRNVEDGGERSLMPVLSVLIVADGIGSMDKSTKKYMKEMFGADLVEDMKLGGSTVQQLMYTALCKKKGDGEGVEQVPHQIGCRVAKEAGAPNPVLADTRSAEHYVAEAMGWNLPLYVSAMVKKPNLKKHNSHEWFFRAFCMDVKADLAFATDCGTVFGKRTLRRLYQHMLDHPECVGVTGHQLVMRRSDQDSPQDMLKHVEEPFLPALARLSQGFDFSSGQLLFKPSNAMVGFLSVIPGPCGLFRFPSLLIQKPREVNKYGLCGLPGRGCRGFWSRLCTIHGGCEYALRLSQPLVEDPTPGCCGWSCFGCNLFSSCNGCNGIDGCEGCCYGAICTPSPPSPPPSSSPPTSPYAASTPLPPTALDVYFEMVNAKHTDLINANIKIAEDRILTWAAALDGGRFKDGKVVKDLELHYVPSAQFFFESEYPVDRLVQQRRRWSNGTCAGNLWLLPYFCNTWCSRDHLTFCCSPQQGRCTLRRACFNPVVTINIIFQILIFFSLCLIPAILTIAFRLSVDAVALLLVVTRHKHEILHKQHTSRISDDVADLTESIGLPIVAVYAACLILHLMVAQFVKWSPITWSAVTILGALLMLVVIISFAWSIGMIVSGGDFADAFFTELKIAARTKQAVDLFRYGITLSTTYAFLPFLLSILLRPMEGEVFLLLRNSLFYYPLLPTFVGALLLYSLARISDVSWGNRPAMMNKGDDDEEEEEEEVDEAEEKEIRRIEARVAKEEEERDLEEEEEEEEKGTGNGAAGGGGGGGGRKGGRRETVEERRAKIRKEVRAEKRKKLRATLYVPNSAGVKPDDHYRSLILSHSTAAATKKWLMDQTSATLRAEWDVLSAFSILRWLIVLGILVANIAAAVALWDYHEANPNSVFYVSAAFLVPGLWPMTRSLLFGLYHFFVILPSKCCGSRNKKISSKANARGVLDARSEEAVKKLFEEDRKAHFDKEDWKREKKVKRE